MKLLVTGAGGFLGWHTRLRLHAKTRHEVIPVSRDNWHRLPELVEGADAILHLAGVNRATSDSEVIEGNTMLAKTLAAVVPASVKQIVYANSTQTGNATPYGEGKAEAAQILGAAADTNEANFVDVHLPNLFGEHGRPHYNSFVATFIDATIRGDIPTIHDRDVPLLHAQDAAQILIEALTAPTSRLVPAVKTYGVEEVWQMIQDFERHYAHGDFPSLADLFSVQLFNSYRAAAFSERRAFALDPKRDPRGMFVETVRCHNGGGQSSISTTAPGVTRGEHYHLRKVERFAVLQGEATIRLRRMFTDDVVAIEVRGDTPTAVDMPTGWVHNITNTGQGTLLTQFWSNELFDPLDTDTYPEPVQDIAVERDHVG